MGSPFVIYFAGVGTVVAALAVGFGGGLALTQTSVVKVSAATSAARAERLRTGGVEAKQQNEAKQMSAAAAPAQQSGGTLLQIATTTPVSQYPATQPQATQPQVNPPVVNEPQNVADRSKPSPSDTATRSQEARKESTELRKFAPRRQDYAERRARDSATREVSTHRVAQEDDFADSRGPQTTTTYVRSYESRSRGGFFGLFADDDD